MAIDASPATATETLTAVAAATTTAPLTWAEGAITVSDR
jgi:hypothetical protein